MTANSEAPEREVRPEWQQLELLVAAIQRRLAPGAAVTHNAKLMGRLSETMRQIDVLVEQSVGQYPVRIVLDCKDYKSPVDVKSVEEFHGLMADVGAHKGALVCPAGFTKSAKKRAKKLDIDLFSPADTDPHKWQVELGLPAICDFRAAKLGLGIATQTPLPLLLPANFHEVHVMDSEGSDLGRLIDIACRQWDEGLYPSEAGLHERVPLLPKVPLTVDNGYGTPVEVELYVSLEITERRYFGHMPIDDLHGLRDEQTGAVITNAFRIKLLDPTVVQNQWVKLADGEEPPTLPVLRVIGLYCLGVE